MQQNNIEMTEKSTTTLLGNGSEDMPREIDKDVLNKPQRIKTPEKSKKVRKKKKGCQKKTMVSFA
jgi:hypothetical protein